MNVVKDRLSRAVLSGLIFVAAYEVMKMVAVILYGNDSRIQIIALYFIMGMLLSNRITPKKHDGVGAVFIILVSLVLAAFGIVF